YPTAAASGILSLKGRCFMLGTASIVWPINAQLARDDRGGFSVLNTTSGKSVRVGEPIAMGGGEVVQLQPGSLDDASAALGQCPAPYFIADNNFRPA
ncbi:MAG: hypothetical protein ABIW83_05345, partial [Allosphingosinicella sp.]